MKMTAEEAVLERMGIDFTAPAPGCCGMAGAFGFEKEKYEISKSIGELELLPAVRQAPTDWLIVADGLVAANRLPRKPTVTRCIWPKCCRWRYTKPPQPGGLSDVDPAPQHYPEDAWVRPHEAAIGSQ